PFMVDTSTGQLSGPREFVRLSQEAFAPYPPQAGVLGWVDLTANPWGLRGLRLGRGQALAYLPSSRGAAPRGFQPPGPLLVVVDGLGTVAVRGNAQMPGDFSLQAYAGGPATGAVSFPDEYPGLLGPGMASDGRAQPRPHAALVPVAHAAGSGCAYPPPK